MLTTWRLLKILPITRECSCNVKACLGSVIRRPLSSNSTVTKLDSQEQPIENYSINSSNQYECLQHVMTPLWKMPYNEQLKEKFKWTKNVVKLINERLESALKGRKIALVSPNIHNVQPSPRITEYRNKDEFSVHTGVDGNPKTLGFFVGSPGSENFACVPGTHIISLKEKHKVIADCFQEYLQISDLPTSLDYAPGGGNWRRFVVRSNEEGHLTAIAICNPKHLSEAKLQEEQQKLKSFFTSGPRRDCCPESLYFQASPHTKCSHEQAPFILLHGEPFLMEHIGEKKFRISPDSFFQVNTKAAEVLYDTIISNANLTSRTTLLDVCCGIGTISILAADHVRGCVGVESVANAVRDAKYNARINNTTNVDFFYGMAEKRLGKIIDDLDLASDIVAVLNPGRAGLDPRVLRTLVKCSQISTIVYVSCKADMPSTLKNFCQLLAEGKFVLNSIVPVDLFPHTWHTELVMTFSRV